MSVHLVGGGTGPEYGGEVYREFLDEATARALSGGRPIARIGVLLVYEESEGGHLWRDQLARAGECETVITEIAEGEVFASAALNDIDGLLIGGGHAPSYLAAVTPLIDEIRLLVADDLPYLGYSAGAMIAADTAIIGGWRVGGVSVCPEEAGEDLDEVTIVEGLGLVDVAIDVHAAQHGTLARLIAATEAGLVDGGIAIDDFTVLTVDDQEIRVVGSGSIWQVSAGEEGVVVSTLGA